MAYEKHILKFKVKMNDPQKLLALPPIIDANHEYLSLVSGANLNEFELSYRTNPAKGKLLYFYGMGLDIKTMDVYTHDEQSEGVLIGNLYNDCLAMGISLDRTSFLETFEKLVLDDMDGVEGEGILQHCDKFIRKASSKEMSITQDEVKTSYTKHYLSNYLSKNKNALDDAPVHTPNPKGNVVLKEKFHSVIKRFADRLHFLVTIQNTINSNMPLVNFISDSGYFMDNMVNMSDGEVKNLRSIIHDSNVVNVDRRLFRVSDFIEHIKYNSSKMGKALKIFFNVNALAKVSPDIELNVMDLLCSDKDTILKTIKKTDGIKDIFKGQVLSNMVKKVSTIFNVDRDNRMANLGNTFYNKVMSKNQPVFLMGKLIKTLIGKL